jgi:hypothetical protein
VESRPHPHGIAVGHFDGDRNADIAIDSWGENKVLVLFGKGDGTYQSPGAKFEVGKMPYQRLRSADVSEDGNADIVTSNFEAGSVSVLLGNGKGGFTRKDFPVPPAPFGVAIEDFNGDHHRDIAIEHYSGQGTDRSKNGLSVLFGDGKGVSLWQKVRRFRSAIIQPPWPVGISTAMASLILWCRITKTVR